MTREYHADGTLPEGDEIWVFGSNLAGIHGAGAALVAHRQFEFPLHQGVGFCGRAYAIPTKDAQLRVLDLYVINQWVEHFVNFARLCIDSHKFFVTAIGCGYARYKPTQIAPMFESAPDNCSFPDTWKGCLGS